MKMYRFGLAVVLLLCASLLYAQNTTVSSTGLVDSDSFTWANGTVTASFVPAPNFPNISSYTWSGGTLLSKYSTTLNGSGAFSLSLPSNIGAIKPSGSQWSLNFCPNATSGCYAYVLSVTGTTQNITTALNAVLPGPRFGLASSNYGYGPVELNVTVPIGTIFFNTTTTTCQQYTGSTWASCSGGDSSGSFAPFVTDAPYNCKCDGSSDDSACMQSAMNANASIQLPVSTASSGLQQCNIASSLLLNNTSLTIYLNGSLLDYTGTGAEFAGGGGYWLSLYNGYIDLSSVTGTPIEFNIYTIPALTLNGVVDNNSGPSGYYSINESASPAVSTINISGGDLEGIVSLQNVWTLSLNGTFIGETSGAAFDLGSDANATQTVSGNYVGTAPTGAALSGTLSQYSSTGSVEITYTYGTLQIGAGTKTLDRCNGGTNDGAFVAASSTQATACTTGGGTLVATGITTN